MRSGYKRAAIVAIAMLVSAGGLRMSSASVIQTNRPMTIGGTADATSTPRSAEAHFQFGIIGALSSDSSLTRPLPLGDAASEDADDAPAPAAGSQSFTRLFVMITMLLAFQWKSRKRNQIANQTAITGSSEHVTPSQLPPGKLSAEKMVAYGEVIDGYNRLKNGTASPEDVDELRRSARSLLSGCDQPAQHQLREVKALLDWLDNACAFGMITITVQQLRERKMGSWDIECGIDAGARTIKTKKSVKGNAEVNGCALKVPWRANGGMKVWMHLTDIGYETCWGHFGPITMTSPAVLQDPSGTSRAFYADQFDKDFKLLFTIQRNFDPLPFFETKLA